MSPLEDLPTAFDSADQAYFFPYTGNEEGCLLFERLPFRSSTGCICYDSQDPPFAFHDPSTKTNIIVWE